MREYSTPRRGSPSPGTRLTDAVVANALAHPDAVAFRLPTGDGWTDLTCSAFRDEVVSVAKGLLALGVASGDRVALMARTCFEWTLLDYALWWVGAVTVPVYANAGAAQVRHVLADSGASWAVVETGEQAGLVTALLAGLPGLAEPLVLETGALGVLRERGAGVADGALERVRRTVGPGHAASIVHTSGTTGDPHGCVLTHGAFLAETRGVLHVLADLFGDGKATTLLFLPLPHVFARVVQVAAVTARVSLGHSGDVRHLVEDLASFRPTFLLAVPRVFEQLYTVASQRAAADGHSRRFSNAVAVAIAWSRALDDGGPGLLLRARHAFHARRTYGEIRALLGDACRWGVCGGAPLGERLGHLYRGVGIPVLEGYGLTETTGAVTLNDPAGHRVGTVGQPLPGTSVRVAGDGELLVRGDQVMGGYWRHPEETAAVLDEDGWLRTGDLGEIDGQGYVRVTGRKREIIVTAGGKYVAPEPLEDLIRASPLVSQCLVVGDGRPYLAAVVTLDQQAAAAWAEDHGADPSRLARDPDLLAEVQVAVDTANRSVSQAEAVRALLVLEEEWTEEAGQLTASLKLRRPVLAAQLHARIADLYQP